MTTMQRRLYLAFALALSLVIITGVISLYWVYSLEGHLRALISAANMNEFNLLISRSQRNLILVLIIIVTGGLLLTLIIPKRAIVSFRRLFMAFKEAEEGNLSVRFPVEGDEETKDFARAFNRLVGQLEGLDDKRVKKIAFEQRRFETLANLLDSAVLVCNVEGMIVFANNQLYRAFHVSSKQILNVALEQLPLPPALVRLISESISRKERVEDMPWELTYTKDETDIRCSMVIDIHPVTRHTGEVVNMLIVLEERDKPRTERIFRREGR